MEYPLENGNWCAYCEDITVRANGWMTYAANSTQPVSGNATCGYDDYDGGQQCTTTCNYDSIQPLTFAKYMLQRRTPGWETRVPALIDFVERKSVDQPPVWYPWRFVWEVLQGRLLLQADLLRAAGPGPAGHTGGAVRRPHRGRAARGPKPHELPHHALRHDPLAVRRRGKVPPPDFYGNS